MTAPMPRDLIRSLILKCMNMRLEVTHHGKNDCSAEAEFHITVA
jgi:hypothetical protein